MNCPDCNKPLYDEHCVCGYRQHPSSAGALTWLTKHCATEGCNTTIRWRATQPMGNPQCKYCDRRAAEAEERAEQEATA